MSKPDGDAIENGALLFASELQAWGHFINSPSDIAPSLADKTKDSGSDDKSDGEEKDKSYQPPKCGNMLDNKTPESIYGSDGKEMVREIEHGCELVCGQWQKVISPEVGC